MRDGEMGRWGGREAIVSRALIPPRRMSSSPSPSPPPPPQSRAQTKIGKWWETLRQSSADELRTLFTSPNAFRLGHYAWFQSLSHRDLVINEYWPRKRLSVCARPPTRLRDLLRAIYV